MAVRPIDGSELMAEIQACNWDSEQDKERAEDLVLGMPTLTPQNEPLTLEELRQMNGEPVYVVEELSNGARFESWVLIGTQKWGYVGLYNQLWQSDYETQARCRNTKYYRRPPEVEK